MAVGIRFCPNTSPPPISGSTGENTNIINKMQNDAGENVDLYIPRKCSWTNRILAANDFGSVQINVANIDPVTGLYTKSYTPFAISGFIRGHSEGDEALTTLSKKNDAAN